MGNLTGLSFVDWMVDVPVSWPANEIYQDTEAVKEERGKGFAKYFIVDKKVDGLRGVQVTEIVPEAKLFVLSFELDAKDSPKAREQIHNVLSKNNQMYVS